MANKQLPSIGDILRAAADEIGDSNYYFSCWAIEEALGTYEGPRLRQILKGLRNMGLDPESGRQFDDVPLEHRALYRKSWLHFAAMIADEQGV